MKIHILSVFLTILGASVAAAQWSGSPSLNTPVIAAPGDQEGPDTAPDGVGGAIIAWSDGRVPSNFDIRVQRIDSTGTVLWAADGVVIGGATGNQRNPVIVNDGAGGAIVAWEDIRSGQPKVYLQRVNGLGTPLWASDGIAASATGGSQISPRIVSDSAGGAMVVWIDLRADAGDIYAQRFDASGVPLWAVNGVGMCTATGLQDQLVAAGDGIGGVVAAWADSRTGTRDIYAQRVAGSGAVAWTANGVVVGGATLSQGLPAIAASPLGIVVAWIDERTNNGQYYAQRLRLDGTPTWTIDGVLVGPSIAINAFTTTIGIDGNGGAVCAWSDLSGPTADILAQRVDSSGAFLWGPGGVVVCGAAFDQLEPLILGDGAGGAYLWWSDQRNGGGDDLYAQRLSPSGTAQWTPDGIEVTRAGGFQAYPRPILLPGGAAITVWQDLRSIIAWDVYAQRIEASGAFPPVSSFALPSGWNLVSVPRNAPSLSAGVLFPGVIDLFSYLTGTYTTAPTLQTGEGYWALFAAPSVANITGGALTSSSVSAPTGNRWYLIGSTTASIPASSVTTTPGGLIASGPYGYNGSSYTSATTIEPGKGYWVLTTAPCTINVGP